MNKLNQEIIKGLKSKDENHIYSTIIRIGKENLKEYIDDVIPFIKSENTILRSAALRTLGFYWGLQEYESIAEGMIEDPEPSAREVAVMTWANYYRGTEDSRVLHKLRDILKDVNEADSVRHQAYIGIMDVAGLEMEYRPKNYMLISDIDKEVNWDLVTILVI